MQQNITLRLEQSLLRSARVLAARRKTSVSGLLRDELRHLVERAEAFEQARRGAAPSPISKWGSTWADARLPATNSMSVDTFFDTNVLIYAHDLDAGTKQRRLESETD